MLHQAKSSGVVNEYWLEAEQSDHKVGGEQNETESERKEALEREKAIADTLGIKAMGQKFNTFITIKVPLKKQVNDAPLMYPSTNIRHSPQMLVTSIRPFAPLLFAPPIPNMLVNEQGEILPNSSIPGIYNAARVSRGYLYGRYKGLPVQKMERTSDEHVIVTFVFYNTVAGGVPSEEDVIAAIDDMEKLLYACSESGRLKDVAFDFMKEKLTIDDCIEIDQKVITQPTSILTNPSEHTSDE